jgi:DNA-binding NtrC family response regulator
MAPLNVLVIDDEPEMAELVADIARGQGHVAMSVTAPALVLPIIEQRTIDLVITDVRMPGIDGIELIAQIKHYDPRIAVIAITAFGSIDTAVRAGALAYLPQPFEPEARGLCIENAAEWRAMSMELSRLRVEVSDRYSPEPVDVRVVAATNRDLRASIADRSFREDLFYRLAVIEIAIPALRDRRDDIVPLADHSLARAAARAGKRIAGFSGAASKRMLAYDWPGNVCELENAVERAVALCDGDLIAPDDLPDATKSPPSPGFLEAAADRMMTIAELDRAYAELILARAGGNKVRAASQLGVDRRTLQRWFGEVEAPDRKK